MISCRVTPLAYGTCHPPFEPESQEAAEGRRSYPLGWAIPAVRASREAPGAATVQVLSPVSLPLDDVRYEILPFESAGEAVAQVDPLTLTVTCSPRHGVDHSVDVACRMRAKGHAVIVHLAARMVRDAEHLDALLARMAAGGVADVFLIGGDGAKPLGSYMSAMDLLPELRAHELAPRTIGVAGYPEGHPLIDETRLDAVLAEKVPLADYMTSQMCFDPSALVRWLERTRERGVSLPLYAGLPGVVDRKRLLEISLRVGVGASVSFIRKQRGLTRLFERGNDHAARLHAAVAPLVGGELGIAGLHFYTFNRLVETTRLAERLVPTTRSTQTR